MSESSGFKVIDRRGQGWSKEPCRVCGAPGDPEPHTLMYNQPTMECIEFLRQELTRLKAQVK